MIPFMDASYLAQVRRLRKLAEVVLKNYPIKNYKLDFINHGENTTFKVSTKNNNYLLRIHRKGYHSQPAILEELKWLDRLTHKSDIKVQAPVPSKNQKLVESYHLDDIGAPRHCDLLHWQEGKIRFKSLNKSHFYNVGVLTAKLHNSSKKFKVRHRNYWDTDGLLGKNAHMGSLWGVKSTFPKYYEEIERCRKYTFQALKKYQNKNSDKMAMIHADLHFGNMIWDSGQVLPIDFDDCGHGFYVYDIAVTLFYFITYSKKIGEARSHSYIEAFLNGYTSVRNLSNEDLKIIPYFTLGRNLTMIGWLNGRSDNPALKKHLKNTMPDKMKIFRNALKKGPLGQDLQFFT